VSRRRRIERRLLATLAMLAVLGTILGGCLDAPVASAPPSPTPLPEPTPITTTYDLDTKVWYEGLELTFGRAVAELDAFGGPVTVSVRIENPAAEETDLKAPIRLVVGAAVVDPTRESRIPSIPGGGAVTVQLEYDIRDMASADTAVVTVGADPLHIARVPFTEAGGDAVVFEPIVFALSGTGTAGSLRVTLRRGELRWDLPDWSQELDDSIVALTITYDVTYVGDFPGGYAFTGDNVQLRLPDGKRVEPRADGRSQSIELIGAGRTKRGLFSRFEIPNGLRGEFRLIVIDGSKQRSIAFTIGA
jgi:hypothetical protein